VKRNKFSKALKHLKSKKIDDKIKSLDEAVPTNSMGGVYQVTPSTGDAFRMDAGDPDKKFYPKADGTWPSGIPANASDTVYTRKGGYFDSGKGTVPTNQTPVSRDFSYDDVTANGTSSTNTFIRPSDGKPYTALPEGTESFILGPLVGNYAINHGYDDFTNIGYIQKDTRQFVLLARIDGFFKGEDRPRTSFGGGNARTFDGTESQFISYNSNFKLEHALWMLDRYNKNDFANNFPFNFSGGVPVERHPDNNSMGMGVIMGIFNALFGGANDNIGTPQDPADVNDINSLDLMGLIKKGITALGDFAIDPFGSIADFVKNDLVDLYDKFSDTALSNDVLEPAFEKFGQFIGSKSGFVLGIVTTAANDIRSYIGGRQSEFGDRPAFSSSNNQFAYAMNLAMSLAQSIGNGRPVVMDNSVVSSQAVAQNISVDDITMMHETNQTPQNGMPNIGMGVDDILNPNKDGVVKKPYMGDGFGGEGGSIMTPFIDNKGKLAISNVGDKFLRLGGESGEGFDINTQTFTDIPSSGNAMGIVDEMVNSGKFADGLTKLLNQQTNDANYNSSIVNDITNQVVDSPTYQNLMTVLDNDTIGGSFVSGSSTGAVNGAAAGALLYNQIKVNLGLMEPTPLQNAGGFGHVRRETIIDVNDLKPEVKNKLDELYGIQESVITESKTRILREIRQPLKEIKELPKTTKLKGYRPNFKGKFSPQNTPDVTASKKSDDIVSGKNASRQIWTAKDKYWKGYETTERMNIIYDNLGHGSQYFDRIVGENVRLKNKKSREVQEHLNMLAHQKALREVYGIKEYENFIDESETYDNKINDPLFTKVAKRLKKEIDYPKKPAAKGYPNEAPPKIDPNTGMHPKYGKRYKYDKLDPQSAEGMPMQGDPEIDANIQKATDSKRKARKIKNLLGK